MTARTSELLALELDNLGLDALAVSARNDLYHDFLSPLAMPETQLVNDLGHAAAGCPDLARQQAILAVRQRVMNGDFDADQEESDAWAKSPEGIAAFNRLITKGDS